MGTNCPWTDCFLWIKFTTGLHNLLFEPAIIFLGGAPSILIPASTFPSSTSFCTTSPASECPITIGFSGNESIQFAQCWTPLFRIRLHKRSGWIFCLNSEGYSFMSTDLEHTPVSFGFKIFFHSAQLVLFTNRSNKNNGFDFIIWKIASVKISFLKMLH